MKASTASPLRISTFKLLGTFAAVAVCAQTIATPTVVHTSDEVDHASAAVPPRVHDDRLQISLYAEDPAIVTPIGAVADAEGRLYVIESHTHSPPAGYRGPKGDLIKVFEGVGPDGRFEQMRVFAEGIRQAQSLEISPAGELYVVCTREVLILHDRDRDGRSEARTRILHLDPYEKNANPHGQMMGIAFSNDGWLYVATGTTSDDWIAADGSRLVVGDYWGGIIARCQPDGTRLERVAWGFWNPFSMTFDGHGRLLVVDNDPDHRGPNRLLHIVVGGDYGFKRTYGRYGLHPYQAWEGELPGTLPMIHGIGEAPTAVIDANRAALPEDYRDAIIGATWGEHNLTLFRPRPAGASLTASSEILVRGLGHDEKVSPFRPSGMAVSPRDGAIYICDWMFIDYTTHGRGRIWRLATKPGVPMMTPRAPYAPQTPPPEFARLLELTDLARPEDHPRLRAALTEDDPFIRNAATVALARPAFRDLVRSDLAHENPRVRLGALLALRRADVADPAEVIRGCLADPDPEVVQVAMIWAGEKELDELTAATDAAASRPNLDKQFFKTWLATMEILQSVSAAKAAGGKRTSRVSGYGRARRLRPEFLEQLVHDPRRPAALRATAIRWLPGIEQTANHQLLDRIARAGDPLLRVEAIRRLGESSRADAAGLLRELALDRAQPVGLREEAIAALARRPDASLARLLDDSEPGIRLEAARALRAVAAEPSVKAALQRKLAAIVGDAREGRLRSQLEFLLFPETVARPASVAEWQRLLADGGDAAAGRRVFFSPSASCNACHVTEGRGARIGEGEGAGFVPLSLGPDLTVVGRTADRAALIHSIVQPSDYIAPEYQGWFVEMKNGERHTGREIDQSRRTIQLVMLDGQEQDFPRAEIATWGAMEHSLMPAGLPQAMAIEEFRDLIAYLEALR